MRYKLNSIVRVVILFKEYKAPISSESYYVAEKKSWYVTVRIKSFPLLIQNVAVSLDDLDRWNN